MSQKRILVLLSLLFGILISYSIFDINIEVRIFIGIIIGLILYGLLNNYLRPKRTFSQPSDEEIDEILPFIEERRKRIRAGEKPNEVDNIILIERDLFFEIGNILGIKTLVNHPNAYYQQIIINDKVLSIEIFKDIGELFEDTDPSVRYLCISDFSTIISNILFAIYKIFQKYPSLTIEIIKLRLISKEPLKRKQIIQKVYLKQEFDKLINEELIIIDRQIKEINEFSNSIEDSSKEDK